MSLFNYQNLSHEGGMLLVSPAPTPSVAPFAALGYLGGIARHHNVPCQLLDLGVDFTNWITSDFQMERMLQENGDIPIPINARAGKIRDSSALEIVNGITESLQTMRQPYTDYSKHEWATQLIRGAFTLYSHGKQGRVELGYFKHPWTEEGLAEINEHLLSESDILSEFTNEAASYITAQNYCVIALTIQHTDQVLPSMAIAKALKRNGYVGKIIAGGVQVSYLVPEISKDPAFFQYIDGYSPKMGEEGMLQVFEVLKDDSKFYDIPNLYFLDNGEVKYTGGYREPKIRELPPPDFTGLQLNSYLVPEITLPIRTATKCYWGKCKFCRITSDSLFDQLSILSAQGLYDQMVHLNKVNGATSFIMADDASPPAVLTKMSQLLIENGKCFTWTAIGLIPEVYIDEKVLELWARAGCSSIAIGFESGSERMLKIMDKSNDLEHIEKILAICRKLQIMTFCYGFYGHPLETREDLIQTLEFKKKNEQVATYFSAGRWLLSPYNIDYLEMDELGITVKEPEVFPIGKEYWLEWDSPRRQAHEETIKELQLVYNHDSGKRNHLSDWIYWGQGAHIPYDWTSKVSTISF